MSLITLTYYETERCNTPAIDNHPCGDTTSAEVSIATQASEFCSKILTDVRFDPCRTAEKVRLHLV
jgi:hypothetical protein